MFDAVSISLLAVLAVGMLVVSRWLMQRRRARMAEGDVLVGAAMQRMGIRVADTPGHVEAQVINAAERCRACDCMSECRTWLKSASGDEPPAQCANRTLLQGLRAHAERSSEQEACNVRPLTP